MKELLNFPTFRNMYNDLRRAKNPAYKASIKIQLSNMIIVLSEAGVIDWWAALEAMRKLDEV